MFIIEILLYIYMNFVVSLPSVNALDFFPNLCYFQNFGNLCEILYTK